jgi:hypothetical protein
MADQDPLHPQNIPLTVEQKELPSGAVMPSGESVFYDFKQSAAPLNETFPSPNDFAEESGTLKTYPRNTTLTQAGAQMPVAIGGITDSILAPYGLSTPFSNSLSGGGITDFKIFNPYIHYYPDAGAPPPMPGQEPNVAVYITYALSYERASSWEPY